MDDLHLALFRGASSQIIALADVLALAPDERAATGASAGWCTASLFVDGEERWGARMSLGDLGTLVAQLPQAADRVERGERALLRAGVFDGPEAAFLVFEPDGEDVVARHVVTRELSDPDLRADGARGAELYEFFAEHADALFAAADDDADIDPQRISRAVLVAALRREHELGTDVLALPDLGAD